MMDDVPEFGEMYSDKELREMQERALSSCAARIRERSETPTFTQEEGDKIARELSALVLPFVRVRRFRFPWRRNKRATAPSASRRSL